MMNNLGVSYDEWAIQDQNIEPSFARNLSKTLEPCLSGYMTSPILKIGDVEYLVKTKSCPADIEYVKNYLRDIAEDGDVVLYNIRQYAELCPNTYMKLTNIRVRFAVIPKKVKHD